MSSKQIRLGPIVTQISTPTGTLLTTASSVGFTTALNAAVPVFNDVKQPLNMNVAYQVIWAFMGQDTVNKGYTITQSSSAAPAVTPVTATPSILLNIPAANLPAAAANTPVIAIFLKAGNGNYGLTEFAYLNSNNGLDFNHLIKGQPLNGAPVGILATDLTTGNPTALLGSRLAGGWVFSNKTPTTGGSTINREVTSVTVSPDNAADFNITTARTVSIEFSLLTNSILDIIEGNAGTYAAYTAGGHSYQEGEMSINTAAALITGNAPLICFLPPDSSGVSEARLYLGQLLQNQTANTEAWTKTATTPIKYTFSAVAIDTLTDGMATEIQTRVV
jgi:hypothetical protein